MQKLLLIFILAGMAMLLVLPAQAQLRTVRFEELEKLQQVEKRPVVVFISTDWCTYCTRMKLGTFRDERVVKQLNEQVYFITLNAEEKKEVHFQGHTFRYKPTGHQTGVHELAEQLGNINGQLSYPTLSVLNSKREIIFQHPGYLSAKDLLRVLSLLNKERI